MRPRGEAHATFRERLTRGADNVDPKKWAGAIPAAFGIAPRLRVGADRRLNALWLVPLGWATARRFDFATSFSSA